MIKFNRKLENMEDELNSVGLDEFAISDHTEGKKITMVDV